MNDCEKVFREENMFSKEDILASFEYFMEKMEQNEYPKCSAITLKNRLNLCDGKTIGVRTFCFTTLSSHSTIFYFGAISEITK